ncbi:hypothetical protein JXA47_02170 [Candidatus Sumerlaeota bacterium]|nr:hypothetical protein [Candidatus Sumerlaeota bacterium]
MRVDVRPHWSPLMVTAITLLAALPSAWAGLSVVDSPHNLSVTGPGPIHAISEDRICIFCHTPHGSRTSAPLWNRNDSTASYQPYESSSLDAAPGQPTGTSKLCLSCHDGTIALGQLVSTFQVIPMTGGVTTLPPGHGLIGTDLRDDHPISFVPVLGNPELAPPSAWGEALRLDALGEFQCTTCHDPHDNVYGDFLTMDNTDGAMCLVCHTLTGWPSASHADARLSAVVLPQHIGPIPGGCAVCHVPHGAGFPPLLRGASADEAVCLACHSGNDPSAPNIAAALRLPSGHFVDRHRGEHRADESPSEAATHATCVDCHNPHRSMNRPSRDALVISGALEGVRGVTLSGIEVDEVQFEYELCLRCHSGRQAEPWGFPVRRQLEQFDLAREIDPGNPSFHPIAAPGQNPDVPSLLPPLTEGSQIQCTDCHSGGQSGVAGPHGSMHDGLLAGENQTGTGVSESPRAYELCYQCHSRSSILADQSFPEHRLHIVEAQATCSACHDPHGVSLTQGDPMNHTHLINFDISVVDPDPTSGRREFVDMGTQAGTCYLTCHGRVHGPEGY